MMVVFMGTKATLTQLPRSNRIQEERKTEALSLRMKTRNKNIFK